MHIAQPLDLVGGFATPGLLVGVDPAEAKDRFTCDGTLGGDGRPPRTSCGHGQGIQPRSGCTRRRFRHRRAAHVSWDRERAHRRHSSRRPARNRRTRETSAQRRRWSRARCTRKTRGHGPRSERRSAPVGMAAASCPPAGWAEPPRPWRRSTGKRRAKSFFVSGRDDGGPRGCPGVFQPPAHGATIDGRAVATRFVFDSIAARPGSVSP
jgi:hypothetical protein